MILKYLKEADVILENSFGKIYYFIDQGISLAIREEDMSHSFIYLGSVEDMWNDIECMLHEEYHSIAKGVELVNQHAIN